MQKYTWAILLIAVIFTACEKKAEEPVIKTVSAVIRADGSVFVTGKITSNGGTVTTRGFCVDTFSNPGKSANTLNADTVNGDSFTGVYRLDFDPFKKYYFRAWVSAKTGVTLGEPIEVTNITYDTTQISCHPVLPHMQVNVHSSNYDESFYYFDSYVGALSAYYLSAATNQFSLDFHFSKIPADGVYRIVDYDNPGAREVFMYFNRTTVSAGTVYVRHIDANTIEVTVCSATSYLDIYPATFSGKFRVRP